MGKQGNYNKSEEERNEEYKKAYGLYMTNYNSLPEEERKGLTDIFTRLSEVRSLMLFQYDILTKLKIREKNLAQLAIDWYRFNNKEANQQDVEIKQKYGED